MMRTPPVQARTLTPPRLTRNEAQARSLLAQRARDCEIVLGDQYALLSVEPLAVPRDADTSSVTPARRSPHWRVRAEWAGAPFEVLMPETACRQWLAGQFPELVIPELTESLRAAFLEAALAQTLDAVHALQRGPIRLEGAATADDDFHEVDAELRQRFAVKIVMNGQLLRVRLRTNSLGLMLMAGLASQREAAAGPLDGESIPIILRAAVGTTRLAASRLASLRPGDAVLLDHSWTQQSGELWLGIDRWGLRVRFEGEQLIVTQPFNHTEAIMDTDLDDEAAGDGGHALPLNDLPVRLQFDLGERSLTLGEVVALQVGQVLDLARPLSQAVNIRANGALIGTGELMEIGGRVAVGITSLGRREEAHTLPATAMDDLHDEDDETLDSIPADAPGHEAHPSAEASAS